LPVKVQIELLSALHHGSGFGIAGLIDRTLLRDGSGIPYLSGAAIKGKLRFAALRWLNANGSPRCTAPLFCEPDAACEICRAFGSPRRQGELVFNDAYPAEGLQLAIMRLLLEESNEPAGTGGSDIRATSTMDRLSGRALAKHLFTTETVGPGLEFELEIGEKQANEHRALIGNCAAMVTEFGAGSNKGLGSCRFTLIPEGK
jgi:CRISPR/Cas system CSM-associated protein Csm3 (group 7 of RAMP superfamily)